MKIMIHSNSPWTTTAYGQQTALLLPRFEKLGHQVAVSAFYGLGGGVIEWNGFTIYPQGDEPYSPDVLPQHAAHWGADLVIPLMDAWSLRPEGLTGVRSANWMPVDCAPLGRFDGNVLRATGSLPIAMSRFGERVLKEAGFDPFYVPHGIDLGIFKPSLTQAEDRRAAGLEGKFVIGINAANKDAIRKAWPDQFMAFAIFHKRHPDAVLLVHTDPNGKSGLRLPDLAAGLGIADAIQWSDPYLQKAGLIGAESMATWYNVLDLYSGCTMAEGFGIPIIEAQACGVPVVVTAASAMPELVGGGWKVQAEPFWNPVHCAWWARPSVDEIVKAYEKAYERGKAYQDRAQRALDFAQSYDVDRVAEKYWQPVLAKIEKLINGMDPTRVIEVGGLKWQIDNTNPGGDMLALHHEADLEEDFFALLPPDGTFLDVGAHVGHYTIRAATRTSGKVIAIEANPETVARLRINVALNNLTNVEVYNVAAWDTQEELFMMSPHGHKRDGSARVMKEGTGPGILAVPLDGILGEETRIDLIKLDVEGADLHALRGLKETLARLRPVLFIEDHSVYGYYRRTDLEGLILALGYEFEDVPKYTGYLIARPSMVSLDKDPNPGDSHGDDH